MGLIYCIANQHNGKVYIGSTHGSGRRRWLQHRSDLRRGAHSNPHLQAAWGKYGESAFKFSVLEYLSGLGGELYLAEQSWVNVCCEEGQELYNIATVGPAPMLGRKHSIKTKAQYSAARKGRSLSIEQRLKIAKALRGKKHTAEHRRRNSEAHKGKSLTLECRHKIGTAFARSYPAFAHRDTGEIIPPGVNLARLCRERGLDRGEMSRVKNGGCKQHKGWHLAASWEHRDTLFVGGE